VILSLNISLFKDTALVATIAVPDLMFVANTINSESYKAVETFTMAAILYFVIAFPVSLITSRIERQSQLAGQRGAKVGPSLLSRMLPGTKVQEVEEIAEEKAEEKI
jgi:polar amino acid transport system permease protein